MTLLCLSSGIRGAESVKCAVYAAGQIALDASADFLVGTAFCPPLFDVFPSLKTGGHFGQCDHVEDAVQASVPTSVQAVPDGVARGSRDVLSCSKSMITPGSSC